MPNATVTTPYRYLTSFYSFSRLREWGLLGGYFCAYRKDKRCDRDDANNDFHNAHHTDTPFRRISSGNANPPLFPSGGVATACRFGTFADYTRKKFSWQVSKNLTEKISAVIIANEKRPANETER